MIRLRRNRCCRWLLAAWLCLHFSNFALADELRPVAILAAKIKGHVHPSICQTADGTLVVVYQGTNVLMCSRSTDQGASWEKPEPIAQTALRPQSIRVVKKFEIYPGTADVLPDDTIVVTWNYIADDKANDGYYERALLFTTSTDEGRTWSDQRLIGPLDGTHLGAVRHNVLAWPDGRWLLPLRVGPPRLFDPATSTIEMFSLRLPDGAQHSFQQIIRTSAGTLLAMGPEFLRSTDGGKHWTLVENFPAPPEGDNAEGRFLTALPNERVLVTWGVGHENRGLRYNHSTDDGQTWSRRSITLLPDLKISARYYSARTIALDDDHVGTVFMNGDGVFFLKVPLAHLVE